MIADIFIVLSLSRIPVVRICDRSSEGNLQKQKAAMTAA
jgi:hypothetical protein